MMYISTEKNSNSAALLQSEKAQKYNHTSVRNYYRLGYTYLENKEPG